MEGRTRRLIKTSDRISERPPRGGLSVCAVGRDWRLADMKWLVLYTENFAIARLNLLALRFHRNWIALHRLDCAERRPAGTVFDLLMEGPVSIIDEDLLALWAEKELLEEACSVGIG